MAKKNLKKKRNNSHLQSEGEISTRFIGKSVRSWSTIDRRTSSMKWLNNRSATTKLTKIFFLEKNQSVKFISRKKNNLFTSYEIFIRWISSNFCWWKDFYW